MKSQMIVCDNCGKSTKDKWEYKIGWFSLKHIVPEQMGAGPTEWDLCSESCLGEYTGKHSLKDNCLK
jgi:hypothetical protein